MLTSTETNLVGPGAPGQVELRNAMQELARAARSLRVLADYLERHPESLIRGKTAEPAAEMKRRARSLLAALRALPHARASPPSRFYTLSGAACCRRRLRAPCRSSVGPVAIPAVVDRPEIVVTVGDNEVWLDEFNRWASPLGEAIALADGGEPGRPLATAARDARSSQSSAIDADYRVSLEVQRFESVPGSYALLDAVYTVRRTRGRRDRRPAARPPAKPRPTSATTRSRPRTAARWRASPRDIAAATRSLAAQRRARPSRHR